jgi:hypothetical protein
MSRALYVNATQPDVLAMCAKHQASISVIEPLQSGGTRVVLRTAHDAAVLARVFGKQILTGTITRMPIRIR